MNWNDIIIIIRNIIDICIVWVIIYYILKSIRNNVKLLLIVKIVATILVVKLISDWLGLIVAGLFLDYIITWGLLALVILFQPELRATLEQLGRAKLLGRHKTLTLDARERLVYEINTAVEYLKRNRMGAMIVIERDTTLEDYIEKSTKLYADISSELIISVFFPNNPLHKGGLIIQGDTITSAGAIFPLTTKDSLNRRLGDRHRGAVGISETTDAIVIIVSEQTGHVSLAIDGELIYNISLDSLKITLIDELRPRKDIYHEDEEDEEVTPNEKA